MAWRGVVRGASAGPGRPERGVPELLRFGDRQAEGAEGGPAPVPVAEGLPAVRPVYRQQPLPGAGERPAAAAEGRGRGGPLVPPPPGCPDERDGDPGRGRAVLRLVRGRGEPGAAARNRCRV